MHTLLDRDSKKKAPPGSGSFYGSGFGFGSDRPSAAAAGMFSCVGCFWVLLSCALVAVCSFSFVSPAWVVREQHLRSGDSVSFGLLWRCSESLDRRYRCYAFGGLGRFAEIPSSSWQTSAVLCSGGCALLAVGSLLAIVTVFLPTGGCERRVCTLAGYIQMAAGVLKSRTDFVTHHLKKMRKPSKKPRGPLLLLLLGNRSPRSTFRGAWGNRKETLETGRKH
ncbi:Transmembrane protein 211 [Merluccius polli]|uniref:Transmembrane protein 211 n=1 Tax=Merluccius polli TaxID=89951 RepID=A0AA47P0U1_MERPO|nr:Transmembrane protein 211 [Merluccius polli]